MNTKNIQKTNNTTSLDSLKKAYNNSKELVKTDVLGVAITNETTENILEFILQSLEKKGKPYYVVTPNPEMIVLASKNPEFKKILNNAKIASNDGIGVGIAAKILGKKLASRTTGVELVENLCKQVANWPITVSFLGGWGDVAEKTSECLRKQYPGLQVGFALSELPDVAMNSMNNTESKSQKDPKSVQHTADHTLPQTDILFVAYGAPKQEFWMADHVGKIPARVLIGVGGAFDYLSGTVPRAPKRIRAFGFEWLFRLLLQPWRWKRQLALIEFAWMVVKEKWQL